MPFVTEEIYGALVPEEESLMISSWPEYKESSCYPEAENIVDHMKEIIRGVRNVRAEMNVAPSLRRRHILSVKMKIFVRDLRRLKSLPCR